VIQWEEKPEKFIANALSPAKIVEVKAEDKNTATVFVPEDQLSLAIGKDGRNVRLAANLTGWKIDIKPVESASVEGEESVEGEAKEPAESEEKKLASAKATADKKEEKPKKEKKTTKVKKAKKEDKGAEQAPTPSDTEAKKEEPEEAPAGETEESK